MRKKAWFSSAYAKTKQVPVPSFWIPLDPLAEYSGTICWWFSWFRGHRSVDTCRSGYPWRDNRWTEPPHLRHRRHIRQWVVWGLTDICANAVEIGNFLKGFVIHHYLGKKIDQKSVAGSQAELGGSGRDHRNRIGRRRDPIDDGKTGTAGPADTPSNALRWDSRMVMSSRNISRISSCLSAWSLELVFIPNRIFIKLSFLVEFTVFVFVVICLIYRILHNRVNLSAYYLRNEIMSDKLSPRTLDE